METARQQISAGQLSAFYLFDVAETIDLSAIPALIGSAAVMARLAPKPATPACFCRSASG